MGGKTGSQTWRPPSNSSFYDAMSSAATQAQSNGPQRGRLPMEANTGSPNVNASQTEYDLAMNSLIGMVTGTGSFKDDLRASAAVAKGRPGTPTQTQAIIDKYGTLGSLLSDEDDSGGGLGTSTDNNDPGDNDSGGVGGR